MRSLVLAVILAMALAVQAEAGGVNVSVREVGGNTIVSCSPEGGSEIEKAFLTLYESDGNYLSISNVEMEISHDNMAEYQLSGVHRKIWGKCKFIMADNTDGKIRRDEFRVSMK